MPLGFAANLVIALLTALIYGTCLAGPRDDFLAAERAYAEGEQGRYLGLKQQLQDYPLLVYLEYREIKDRLSTETADKVARFLDTYADTPQASRLLGLWLDRLAQEGRWSEYASFYDPTDTDTKRQCQYLDALIRTGNKAAAFAEAPDIWRHGHSRPDSCTPVIEAWSSAGRLTTDLVWERIALAMDSGSSRLAKYLERYLPPQDRHWLTLWLEIDSEPEKVRQSSLLNGSHPYKKAIIAHGIKGLGKSDPHLAADIWKSYRTQFGFTEDEACAVDENLAIRLEDERDAAAYRFFKEMEPCRNADRLQEARIRAALLREDWPAVARWIDALPKELQAEDRWLYWKGRALEATGKKREAEKSYRATAGERSYYGFLAADRIGTPYHLDDVPISAPRETLSRLRTLPAMRRMEELLALDRTIDARREWLKLIPTLDTDELRAAAGIFDEWGWLDRAIFTAARADYWDDLKLRFPLRHEDLVRRYADERSLDPSWVFGVLRQESAFMPEVRSSAGAVGLMQLLPATARRVAKEFDMPKPNAHSLTEPGTNIALGTGYLRMMLDDLASNPVLATAAYNAGPHRVMRWMPPATQEADIWAELIPFKETREYVWRVMAYTVIYDQRRGIKPLRLSERMRPVRGSG